MQNMRIRELEPFENDVAIDVMRSAITGRCSKFYGEHTVKKWVSKDNDRFKFQLPENVFCVANDDGPVSIAGWNRKSNPQKGQDMEGCARVSAVFTRPDFAGRGIGRQLMKLIEDDIRKAGFSHISLGATMNAVRFYRQMGFDDRGDQLLEVANGHFITIRRMIKEIAPQESEISLERV